MSIDEIIKKEENSSISNYELSKVYADDNGVYSHSHTLYYDKAQYHEEIVNYLQQYKALDLLLDWAIECGFGLDSMPEEYEEYHDCLSDEMSYKEMLITIAQLCLTDK